MASAVISKFRVTNYEVWKQQYDAGEEMRRSAGVRGVQLFRDASDPNLVPIVTRFDNVDAAKQMLASDAFKASARTSGAPPMEIFFTDVVDERTY